MDAIEQWIASSVSDGQAKLRSGCSDGAGAPPLNRDVPV